MKAIEIESRVRAAFPIGARVRYRQDCVVAHRKQRGGTVMGYAFGGEFIDGVRSRSALAVLWDGNKTSAVAHYSHFERIEEPVAA